MNYWIVMKDLNIKMKLIKLIEKIIINRKREKYWRNKEWMYNYVDIHFID
jgi:NACalpha-BTF3-like transcription factor